MWVRTLLVFQRRWGGRARDGIYHIYTYMYIWLFVLGLGGMDKGYFDAKPELFRLFLIFLS